MRRSRKCRNLWRGRKLRQPEQVPDTVLYPVCLHSGYPGCQQTEGEQQDERQVDQSA